MIKLAMSLNSPDPLHFPGLAEIERIAALQDPVLRNLQITQCYHELSQALAERITPGANWCTFATWASKQAGQTIRKEDLKRLLEDRLRTSPEALQAQQTFVAAADASPAQSTSLGLLGLETSSFTSAIDLASQAVGRGNLKVFAEIGREFARFCTACLPDSQPDQGNIEAFCQLLREGDPPEGQRYLYQAFKHYYLAQFTGDERLRAQLVLLANLEIGFHEQTRLQPEIAESLDAGLISALQFTRQLLATLFPFGGWLAFAQLYLRRLLGRPAQLDQAIQALLAIVRRELHLVITETMMTISLPGGQRLRLGKDLDVAYPADLQTIDQPELEAFLSQVDPTQDSLVDSGALDWADLPDRMNYIAELFRCFQETPNLLGAPYTKQQVADLKAGRLPRGEL